MAKVIPIEGKEYETKDLSLENMQKIVGGYIEIITLKDHKTSMVLNEEGKITDPPLPLNPRANKLAAGSLFEGDYIAGNVIVCQPGELK